MNFTAAIEKFGEPQLLLMGGALVGLLFGFMAQRSRFCLRAAVIEFWRGQYGEKLAVWLLAFSAAVVVVQALVVGSIIDVSTARQLATRGSLSGAIVGGLMFGVGMILTRGCASRLLVLSAGGNLRALLSGLVFAVTAQASIGGVLAPMRHEISSWWTVEGGPSRDLLAIFGVGHWGGLAFGGLWLAAALWFSLRSRDSLWKWLGGLGTGLAVAGGWAFTSLVATHSFEVVPVQGVTFSGPSADWLMRILASPNQPLGFDTGLLPGVFAGAFLAAWIGGDLKLEGFKDGYSMRRYLVGAPLMGFGAMLAGGCAVGAGVTGGSVFALTAWVALIGMWVGAGLTDWAMDRRSELGQVQAPPTMAPAAPMAP